MDGGTLAMYALPTNFGGAQNRGGYRGRPPGIPVVPDQKDMKERFVNPLLGTQAVATFDGKRMRKAIHRKTVDYNSAVIKYVQNRIWQRDYRDKRAIQPDNLYQLDIEPPCSTLENPINAVTTKFVRTSTNKFRCPIFVLTWTPEGRRLVTGASSGEFTLWNGLAFNFETILQAHDTSVRAMRWSHNDQWMVTADHSGYIKYWQTNMNNVKMYQGHKEPVRGIRWADESKRAATISYRPRAFLHVISISSLFLYVVTYLISPQFQTVMFLSCIGMIIKSNVISVIIVTCNKSLLINEIINENVVFVSSCLPRYLMHVCEIFFCSNNLKYSSILLMISAIDNTNSLINEMINKCVSSFSRYFKLVSNLFMLRCFKISKKGYYNIKFFLNKLFIHKILNMPSVFWSLFVRINFR